jgi:hypothetical protein
MGIIKNTIPGYDISSLRGDKQALHEIIAEQFAPYLEVRKLPPGSILQTILISVNFSGSTLTSPPEIFRQLSIINK